MGGPIPPIDCSAYGCVAMRMAGAWAKLGRDAGRTGRGAYIGGRGGGETGVKAKKARGGGSGCSAGQWGRGRGVVYHIPWPADREAQGRPYASLLKEHYR